MKAATLGGGHRPLVSKEHHLLTLVKSWGRQRMPDWPYFLSEALWLQKTLFSILGREPESKPHYTLSVNCWIYHLVPYLTKAGSLVCILCALQSNNSLDLNGSETTRGSWSCSDSCLLCHRQRFSPPIHAPQLMFLSHCWVSPYEQTAAQGVGSGYLMILISPVPTRASDYVD